MKKQLVLTLFLLLLALDGRTQELSVLSYNLRLDIASDSLDRWDLRKDFLIGQLYFYEPDIFGVQEGLLHQLQAIKGGLPGYEYIGKGRDEGDDAGEFSAIFYNTETIDLLEENTFWLSETPETPSKGWDAAIKRICTYGLFRTRDTDRKFYVFNTHLDHIGEQARKESISLILKRIAQINSDQLPVLLTGDFNLEPDHPSISSLNKVMADAHLLAGEHAFGPEGTFNGFKYEEPVSRRIDYIFLSAENFDLRKYAILSASRNRRFPSDHFPVIAILDFRN